MYEQSKPMKAFGSTVQHDELPLPEGQTLSPELVSALSQLPLEMELPVVGHATPWATKKNDLEWDANEAAPSHNLKLYGINAEKVRKAFDKLFGQPIPFIGVLTDEPLMHTEVLGALEGTDYELYETLAVYSQDDKDPVPPISYFYWLSMGPEGTKRTKSLDVAAQQMHGTLVLPSRVPYASSTQRAFPAMSFEEALNSDLTEISDVDGESYTPPQVPTKQKTTAASMPIVPMVVVGAGLAALTVWLGGKAMEK